MRSLYWIGGIFVVLVLVLVYFGGGSAKITPPLEIDKINPNDHVKGLKEGAKVIVIEYADFQCPACRNYYPIMKQLEQEFGGKASFVYSHFPLTGIHMNAEFAARASEAAGKQGKFWEMHDLLFEKQEEWATKGDFMPLFEDYATLVGISVEKFKTDFNSKEVKDLVKGYRNYGNSIGVQSTPTFYINGKKIDNPQSVEAFRILINQALKTI